MNSLFLSCVSIFSAALCGLFCQSKAIKYKKRPFLWFWIGFAFGLLGILAFYVSLELTQVRALQSPKKPPARKIKHPLGLWYYHLDGKTEGPVSAEFIETLLKKEELSIDAMVWHESLTDWTKLETVLD